MERLLSNQSPKNLVDTPTGRRVLVVDDNHASRIVAKAIFERENYEVTLAKNGTEAVAVAQAQTFDLILMDVQMPDINGIEATRRIRATAPANAKTPVVALTAYADTLIIKDAQVAGISEVLLKPLKMEQLRTAWQRALNISGENAEPLKQASEPTRHKLKDEAADNPHAAELLDFAIIDLLMETATREVLLKLYNRFNETTEKFISDISAEIPNVASGQSAALDRVRRSAHALKGSASSVGFKRLSQNAARLQNAPHYELDILTARLSPLLKISETALQNYQAQRG